MLAANRLVYCSAECCVRGQDGDIYFFGCPTGLQQGCKLSPLLFSIIINDIANEFRRACKHGIQLSPARDDLFNLTFLDHVALISYTAMGLQNQLAVTCYAPNVGEPRSSGQRCKKQHGSF